MSEVVSNTSPTTFFTEIALMIFLAVFVGVVLYLWVFAKPAALERAAMMPLDDERPQEARHPEKTTDARDAAKGVGQ
jgi:cbb3-type cytochrome oxidase subunit 3